MVEGSREARADDFDAWVAAHGTNLLRFTFAVTGSRAAGEDLAREALARAFARWGSVSAMDDPLAHLRRTIIDLHLSRWRNINPRRRSASLSTTIIEQVPGLEPDPRAAHLWQLDQRLPHRQRVALVLRCYENLTYDDIAGLMGTSSTTARNQVDRAIESMHECDAMPLRRGIQQQVAVIGTAGSLGLRSREHAARRRRRQITGIAAGLAATAALTPLCVTLAQSFDQPQGPDGPVIHARERGDHEGAMQAGVRGPIRLSKGCLVVNDDPVAPVVLGDQDLVVWPAETGWIRSQGRSSCPTERGCL